MGTLLNRRRYMGGGEDAPLPPGAVRIEYLCATGTQWIDTGINCLPDYSIEAVFYYDTSSGHSNRQVPFGQDIDNGIGVSYNTGGGTPWGCIFGTEVQTTKKNSAIATRLTNEKFKVTISNKIFSFYKEDGTYIGGAQFDTEPSFSALTMYLFAFSRSTKIYTGNANVRCYSFVIKDGNGSKVLDFVPVRVEQVGYMYDRVNGQLFGNSGTGDFILGPDKT